MKYLLLSRTAVFSILLSILAFSCTQEDFEDPQLTQEQLLEKLANDSEFHDLLAQTETLFDGLNSVKNAKESELKVLFQTDVDRIKNKYTALEEVYPNFGSLLNQVETRASEFPSLSGSINAHAKSQDCYNDERNGCHIGCYTSGLFCVRLAESFSDLVTCSFTNAACEYVCDELYCNNNEE